MFDVPEYRYIGGSVWEAAAEIHEGDVVKVKYHSKRANGIKEMEGEVVEVEAREGFCHITFVRDDGQKVRVEDDGGLYSIGSHHPHNGDYSGIQVKSN